MLRYFLEKTEHENSSLFRHLAISQYPEYCAMQGKYPVIFLTFKDNKQPTWEKTFDHFRQLIKEECIRHRYLLDSNALAPEEQADFRQLLRGEANHTLCENSLRLLTKWLAAHHKINPLVLVDEYDAPAHAAYNDNFYPDLIAFLRNFLSGGLKDNSYLERGILTGILRIAKESIFSGMNNVSIFSLLEPEFYDKFGLTESEIQELLPQYDLENSFQNIKQWYNGYCIGSYNHIYNPWSVLNCIAKGGTISPYWVNSSDNELMKKYIRIASGADKVDLEQLLQGHSILKKISEGFIFTDLDTKPTALWNLLLHSGYLTLEKASIGPFYSLRIPNKEL